MHVPGPARPSLLRLAVHPAIALLAGPWRLGRELPPGLVADATDPALLAVFQGRAGQVGRDPALNVLAAATAGVSIKDLMSRMGHASPAAALRYQHATKDRDATIARALAALIQPNPAPVVSLDDARR